MKKFADYLSVKDLIASNVDRTNGKFLDVNCKGENKVKFFLEKYPDCTIKKFYTDNLSDIPLMKISEQSYIVNGNDISEFHF